ncbi:MAG: TVP38/TMEM64 family protein [Synergistaceae bacterium]|nr:TVP38/TMEM64 family protein [Synergistaceae bacterium]
MSHQSSSGIWAKILILAVLALLIASYFIFPDYKNFIDLTLSAFASGDFKSMRDFIANYGTYAALISFFLMIFQSVAAPLPAFIITLANANLFGWVKGAVLSWSSAMAGAALCFYIARILGQDTAERLTSKAGLESINTFFERYGTHSILIARLLPFISFDLVSYAAGLTSMRFWPFFIATGLGQLPATIVYSYVGGMLTGGAKLLMTGLLILFALSALVVLMRKIYKERKK